MIENTPPSPLVSVLIPTFNAGEYLRPALQSILSQTYSNLEIFIIDDGCTDGCIKTIKDIESNRMHILHQKNLGKASALNNALEIIKGDYWIIQDADDLSYPERVREQLVELINNQNLAAVYTGHDLLIETCQFAPSFSPIDSDQCKHEILNFRIPAHDATGMYKSEYTKNLFFDQSLKIGQGIDFVFQIGEKFPIKVLGRCLYTYRINYNSTIRKNPSDNSIWIERVMLKARKRRGEVVIENKNIKTIKYKTKNRAKNNHIVSHCIRSIYDFKKLNIIKIPVLIGFKCVKLNFLDIYFYRPLALALTPLFIVSLYKKIKNLIIN